MFTHKRVLTESASSQLSSPSLNNSPRMFQPAPVSLMPQKTPNSNSMKILLADDNPVNRMLVKRLLENNFICEVIVAKNGDEGISKYNNTFNLIITDHLMDENPNHPLQERHNGDYMIREIRELERQHHILTRNNNNKTLKIPVIVYSSVVDSGGAQFEALKLSYHDNDIQYLGKVACVKDLRAAFNVFHNQGVLNYEEKMTEQRPQPLSSQVNTHKHFKASPVIEQASPCVNEQRPSSVSGQEQSAPIVTSTLLQEVVSSLPASFFPQPPTSIASDVLLNNPISPPRSSA